MRKRAGRSAQFEVRNAGWNFFGVKIVNAGTCDGKVNILRGSAGRAQDEIEKSIECRKQRLSRVWRAFVDWRPRRRLAENDRLIQHFSLSRRITRRSGSVVFRG